MRPPQVHVILDITFEWRDQPGAGEYLVHRALCSCGHKTAPTMWWDTAVRDGGRHVDRRRWR